MKYIAFTTSILASIALANQAQEKPLLASGNDGAPLYWSEDSWTQSDSEEISSLEIYKRSVNYADIDHGKRPVIGVLTEPLRGDMYKVKENFYGDQEKLHEQSEQSATYVPKAHVQFLEQAGVRVVPIDYRLSTEERHKLYDQLNGVYMPGDSH
jgi:hypothetical protein